MGIYKLSKYNDSPRRRYFIERVMKDIEKYSMSHDVFAKPFPLRNNGFKQSISENMLVSIFRLFVKYQDEYC